MKGRRKRKPTIRQRLLAFRERDKELYRKWRAGVLTPVRSPFGGYSPAYLDFIRVLQKVK